MSPIITAGLVSILRDRTSEPMMRCKEALVACEGDMEKATEYLRHPPKDPLELRVAVLERQVRNLIESICKPTANYGGF